MPDEKKQESPKASPPPPAPSRYEFLTNAGQFTKGAIATEEEILKAHPKVDIKDWLNIKTIRKAPVHE